MEPWEYWALQNQGRPAVTVQLSQWDGKWLEQGLVRGKRRVGRAESGARTRRPVLGVAGLSLGPMWGAQCRQVSSHLPDFRLQQEELGRAVVEATDIQEPLGSPRACVSSPPRADRV